MWVPVDRLLAILDRYPDLFLSPTAERRVRLMRSGSQEFVSLRSADNLLTPLDLNHWFHIPKEEGGLADIYEDGEQYGEPEWLGPRRLPRPHQRKYATEEERVEARRATWRRRYARQTGRAA